MSLILNALRKSIIVFSRSLALVGVAVIAMLSVGAHAQVADGYLMKVRILNFEPAPQYNIFWIRTAYNSTQDLMIVYYINNNGLISPCRVRLGANTLSDSELANAPAVSEHKDSTAPLSGVTQYWCLYSQHGYVHPQIANTVGMTAADEGAKWQDQLGRGYTIGQVTAANITLLSLPTIDAQGNATRGWRTPYGPKITRLTHVSGGEYTEAFDVSGLTHVQLRPIMKVENRRFFIDGEEVFSPGYYNCNEFSVGEDQIGFDPATITSLYPKPDLSTADVMARYSWHYNFTGPSCLSHVTFEMVKPLQFDRLSATQQQFFYDKDGYEAEFIVPKSYMTSDGRDFNYPQHLGSSSCPDYFWYRTTSKVSDSDPLIDRMIGMLHNPSTDEYKVGMAAGLSLVSGSTMESERKKHIPLWSSTSGRNQQLLLSPMNINKFYVSAFTTGEFADGVVPSGTRREIDYYVTYFDPAENHGQTYWYKDGDQYLIYCHSQQATDNMDITLPDHIGDMGLEIVERSEGATLNTAAIVDHKINVTFDDGANYLVVKASPVSGPNVLTYRNESCKPENGINYVAKDDDDCWVANEVVITDAAPFNAAYPLIAKQLTYTRTFANTEWQALYVPFDMSVEEWEDYAEVAKINDVHQFDDDQDGVIDETIVEFLRVKSGRLTPNVPYVIKPHATGTVKFECSDKRIEATPVEDATIDCSSTETLYTITGIYREKTDMRTSGAYALSEGVFVQAASDEVTLKPMRHYLTITPRIYGAAVQKPAKMRLMVDGQIIGTEGIESVEADSQDVKQYDLLGRPVNAPASGTITVTAGKKTYNK